METVAGEVSMPDAAVFRLAGAARVKDATDMVMHVEVSRLEVVTTMAESVVVMTMEQGVGTKATMPAVVVVAATDQTAISSRASLANSAGRGTGQGHDNWEDPYGNYQRDNNFNSNNRFAYGGNQQRWNSGRGGGFVNRPHAGGTEPNARSGFDADLLQQTVHAVVAAVTAATKANETPTVRAAQVADLDTAKDLQGGMPAAAPKPTPQPIVAGQEAQGIQDGGAKGKDNEVQGPPPKKKDDKTGCFRCKQPGHHIDDCPLPFCDICESVHHATTACHLLNAPKPSAILHGYANEALMFFELSCGAFKAKAENPKLAKVTVDGEAMTIPQLIEQLKKIVPSEKFNWEVFHFKDNVYRVKLPSKLEVQRLNFFGTYICTDRESHLTFDLWSSLEEPLYMLPEVWVRVLGLPSDIITDYLSLWSVGTLFGKTLDVDMAYTRTNKVLRIKIGCLDKRLIPEDCDMFIRRGFFKLHFEVEAANQSQEVNMIDASNENGGNDDAHNGGNDDAHNGKGKDSGGHSMDMETKGNDLKGQSKTNEQDESNLNNDVDDLSARGSALGSVLISAGDQCGPTIGQQAAVVQPLSHAGVSGPAPRQPVNGQREVAGRQSAPGANGKSLATHLTQHQRPVSSSPAPVSPAWDGSSQPQLDTGRVVGERTSSGQPMHAVVSSVVRTSSYAGSSMADSLVLNSAVPTQKIRPDLPGSQRLPMADAANHQTMIGTDVQSLVHDGGSSVAAVTVVNGITRKLKDNVMDVSRVHANQIPVSCLQGSMGVASSPQTNEEVIAFGGIPKPTLGVRSTTRLGGQPNADMSQMERAMKNAQLRDESFSPGQFLKPTYSIVNIPDSEISYSYGLPLDPALSPTLSGGAAGCHGFWMHTAPDGRSGYLVPGWLAAY
ncbi:hypothetical protein QYE76_050232 [Lolium multiflorum]|uniref:CCHC-type domain-containing protein n=1 Tax=Lolium multiflorum TaxID=4521 RepID=A0AAD8SRH6_LOLMU|nr:hypothetical protein QYE76_050232 [Lolium multiflorum]